MWRYYYMNDDTRTIYHSSQEQEDRPDLIFVGMSQNPNPKMAVAVFVQKDQITRGYKIRALD